MKTHKKCFGQNKAFGFDACGDMVIAKTRKFGLCPKCYPKWLFSDDERANAVKESFLISNKKKVETSEKKKKLIEINEIKKKLETKSKLEKRLQKEINLIVRLIDKGHKCISSGRDLGKSADAGHLYTTQAHPTIRFNLFNIFAQSVNDNQWKSGNELEYFFRLGELFGSDFQGFVVSLKQIPPLHLSKDDLRDKISLARGIVKWIKLQEKTYTLTERITLRNEINIKLGIYDERFCVFKN